MGFQMQRVPDVSPLCKLKLRDHLKMVIAGQNRSTRAQSADCNDNIGQRQNPTCTIQVPREVLRFLPGAVIHRDVDKKVEEHRQIGARLCANDAA